MAYSGKRPLIQTFLLDGVLEGIKVVEIYGRNIRAYVIPRLKLQDIKDNPQLKQSTLYFLLSADDAQAYIGETDNFYSRIKNHDQNKEFWDVAIAFISKDKSLEKSDVKYLESLAIERANQSGVTILNSTAPPRNHVHTFKQDSLDEILMEDIWMILTFLGYSVFVLPVVKERIWSCITNKTSANAVFRGDKFIVLKGSIIDMKFSSAWATSWPKSLAEREQIFKDFGKRKESVIELMSDVAFKSPNQAGGFTAGRNINAWVTWKDKSGRTMDEIMRKGEK